MRFPIGIFTNRKAIAPITEAMAFMLLNGYFWVVLIRGDPWFLRFFFLGLSLKEFFSERLFISLSCWVCSAGLLFPRRKSRQKGAGDTPVPVLAQSVSIGIDTALPLNQRILRASDPRRAARPASADALLKR